MSLTYNNTWLVLLIIIFNGCCCQASCGPRVRREWRELTYAEQQLYLDAVQALKTSGTYDTFPPDHSAFAGIAHGNLKFLPWHRAYLLAFEDALRAQGPPYDCVTLPFWDWTRDSGTSAQQYASSLFNSNAFGDGLGSPGTGCVQDGVAFGWTIGGGGCLTRRQTPSGLTFSSQPYMQGLVSGNPQYNNFAGILEGGPHGTPHVFVGGQMGLVAASPEDPLFWVHHNMVDMAWALWQVCHGYDNVHPNNIDGHPSWQGFTTSELNTVLPPFSQTPRDTHRITDLGYAFGWGRGNGLAEFVRDSGVCGGHLPATTWFYDPPQPCDYTTCSTCTSAGYGWCRHPLGGYCSATQGSCPSSYWHNPTSWWGRRCFFIIAWPIRAVELSRSITVLRRQTGIPPPPNGDIALANNLQCYLDKEVTERQMYDAQQCGNSEGDPTLERWFTDAGDKDALEQLRKGAFDPFCGKHVPSRDYCPIQFPGASLLGSKAKIEIEYQGNSYRFDNSVSQNTVEVNPFRNKNDRQSNTVPLSVDISTNNVRVIPSDDIRTAATIRVHLSPRCGSNDIRAYTIHYENDYNQYYEQEPENNRDYPVVKVDTRGGVVEVVYPGTGTKGVDELQANSGVNVMLYYVDPADIFAQKA